MSSSRIKLTKISANHSSVQCPSECELSPMSGYDTTASTSGGITLTSRMSAKATDMK